MLSLYHDLRRILILTENLLYLAGKSLQRRAVRNGVLVSIAMSSTIVKINFLTAQTLSTRQLTALVIGAFASYPLGALLVRVSNFMTRDNLEAAAGGHLHLTSHFKQSRMRLHLHYLWHEVFCHEPWRSPVPVPAATGDTTAAGTGDAFAGLFHERGFRDEDEHRRHDEFVAAALDALRSPLPMGVQSARIGVHLGPLEDWYEKGFFAYEDFPAKAFSRDPLIKRAQRLVDTPMANRLRRLMAREAAPSFWYAFTVRKFGTLLGKSLVTLNRKSERTGFPDYFDAQHYVWPSEELDAEVARRFGESRPDLVVELETRRRQVMHQVFSGDRATAMRHVMRMFLRDYVVALKLRLDFDAEYAAGRLHTAPADEVADIERWFSLRAVKPGVLEGHERRAREILERLDAVVTRPAGDRRAVYGHITLQVAAYIDYRSFRRRFLDNAAPGGLDHLLTPGSDVREHLGLLLECLRRVRLYHALVKMQALDYWTIVSRIGRL